MFQVSCQNIKNFSRNLNFQVGGRHVRVLIIVCAGKKEFVHKNVYKKGEIYFSF